VIVIDGETGLTLDSVKLPVGACTYSVTCNFHTWIVMSLKYAGILFSCTHIWREGNSFVFCSFEFCSLTD